MSQENILSSGSAAESDAILGKVREIVANSLALEVEEVLPDATLFGDLGTESIDLLDFLFQIEQQLSVKIQANDLTGIIQGGIPDEEFGTADGTVSEVGLAQLKKSMPQIDVDALRGNLHAEDVMNHFTVANLARIIEQRVDGA